MDCRRVNGIRESIDRLNVSAWKIGGAQIAGYDPATLYMLALRTPDTAKKVHDTFADILDSPDGLRAQLMVIARYLRRVDNGEFMGYADHLHRHARKLLDRP